MPRPPLAVLPALAALAASLLVVPGAAGRDEFIPLDEFVGDDGLTGDDIYDRVVQNRFEAYDQRLSMLSGDRGGSYQGVEIRLRYKKYPDEDDEVVSKTIAKYFEPTDVRHLGYLVINKRRGPDDQFVYRPTARQVRRVNVRGESVAGTDFSFEDIVPSEFDDGHHYRLADEEVDGIETFVVTVVPRPEADSEYAKLVVWVEKQHAVPIRTDYWNSNRVRIKRLEADPSTLTRYEAAVSGGTREVWIATKSRMTHLKLGTYTELTIESLEANPKLRDRHFSERELTKSR